MQSMLKLCPERWGLRLSLLPERSRTLERGVHGETRFSFWLRRAVSAPCARQRMMSKAAAESRERVIWLVRGAVCG